MDEHLFKIDHRNRLSEQQEQANTTDNSTENKLMTWLKYHLNQGGDESWEKHCEQGVANEDDVRRVWREDPAREEHRRETEQNKKVITSPNLALLRAVLKRCMRKCTKTRHIYVVWLLKKSPIIGPVPFCHDIISPVNHLKINKYINGWPPHWSVLFHSLCLRSYDVYLVLVCFFVLWQRQEVESETCSTEREPTKLEITELKDPNYWLGRLLT